MPVQYSKEEMLEMLCECKEQHGKCAPSDFNMMDDTCSASAVMKRFGSWTEAKKQAGIEEDLSSSTGSKREYENQDILQHLRECARRNGKCTVRALQEEKDLVSASVAVERFGSWSEAKKKAGLEDDRSTNSRPRQYSDKEYIRLLQACERIHGKVTQKTFNNDDTMPTAGAVRKRFGDEEGRNGWSRAKKQAGVESSSKKWTNEELLEQLRQCEERYGSCSAAKFASDEDFASPETLQRRFDTWNHAKKKAGVE